MANAHPIDPRALERLQEAQASFAALRLKSSLIARLSELSPRQRELVGLRALGLSISQCAAVMDVRRQTVWRCWRRIARIMREADAIDFLSAAP